MAETYNIIRPLKLGDIVMFIGRKKNECHPNYGSEGYFIEYKDDALLVQWPDGETKAPGRWYVGDKDVVFVARPLDGHGEMTLPEWSSDGSAIDEMFDEYKEK